MLASDPFFYGGGWTADASHKVMRFVDFAETFHLPVVHFVDIPGFVIGVAAEKAATIRHGARALAAIYQSKAPWCSILMRKAFGVAGAAHQNWQKYNFRYAWPSGDWGSLPLEGGIEAAYKAELAAAPDPARASGGDRGAAEQGALALPHRRALRHRGDHRSARHASAACASSPTSRRPCASPARAASATAREAPTRPITAKYLQNAATFYLERYPSTAEGLRRVLNRRVAKARLLDAPVMDDVERTIEAIVAKFVDAGVIDDKAFAQTKARALHRRGTSTRLTRRKLELAGIDAATLDLAMAGLDEELDTDPGRREWRAAAALARRRRLGPYRPAEDRKDHRARDLAAMARAGFDYDLARKVIDAPTPDALDEA